MDKKKTWHDWMSLVNLSAFLIGGTWIIALEHTSNAVQAEQITYMNKRIDEIASSQLRFEEKFNELYKMQMSYADESDRVNKKMGFFMNDKEKEEYVV